MPLVMGDLSHRKPPILTLKLSETSFLNSAVTDDVQNHDLYKIKTNGTTTIVSRNVKETGEVLKIADIKWPKLVQHKEKRKLGVLVQMRGERWRTSEHYLTPATLLGAHKFWITGYSQPLKWKRLGWAYHCTTKGLKGPIAILETALASHPARISLYETLHDRYDPSALSMHSGVSILLLDHIVTTSLLLATDPYGWMKPEDHRELMASQNDRKNGIGRLLQIRILSPGSNWHGGSLTGNSFKLPFGEKVLSRISATPSRANGQTIADQTTPAQIAKVVYREPMYPKLSSSTDREEPDEDLENEAKEPETPISPAAQSEVPHDDEVYAYLQSSSLDRPFLRHLPTSMGPAPPAVLLTPFPAANHTYYDPSFYSQSEEELNITRPRTADSELDLAPGRLDFGPTLTSKSSSSTVGAIRPLPPIPGQSSPLARHSSDHDISQYASSSDQQGSMNHRHPHLPIPQYDPSTWTQLSLSFALALSRSQSAPADKIDQMPSSTAASCGSLSSKRTSVISSASGSRSPRILPKVPAPPAAQLSPTSSAFSLNSPTPKPSRPQPAHALGHPFLHRSDQDSIARSVSTPQPQITHSHPPPHGVEHPIPHPQHLPLPLPQTQPNPPHDLPSLPKSQHILLLDKDQSPASTPNARNTVFEVPPPAYHSINFQLPSPVVGSSELEGGLAGVAASSGPGSLPIPMGSVPVSRTNTTGSVGRRALPKPPQASKLGTVGSAAP